MAKLTIERDITKPVSEREEDAADLLMAAMIDGDTERVARMLTKNRAIRTLLDRGALRLFTDAPA